MIPVISTDVDDALAMDFSVVKRICLLESSMPDDFFELRKESVESLDAGYFPLFKKRSYLVNVKVG